MTTRTDTRGKHPRHHTPRQRPPLAAQTSAARAVRWHEARAAEEMNHTHAMWHMDAAVAILGDSWRSIVGHHEIERVARWHEARAEHYVCLNLLADWHRNCATQLRALATRP